MGIEKSQEKEKVGNRKSSFIETGGLEEPIYRKLGLRKVHLQKLGDCGEVTNGVPITDF